MTVHEQGNDKAENNYPILRIIGGRVLSDHGFEWTLTPEPARYFAGTTSHAAVIPVTRLCDAVGGSFQPRRVGLMTGELEPCSPSLE